MPIMRDTEALAEERAAWAREKRHAFCWNCNYWDRTDRDPHDLVSNPYNPARARACKLYPTVIYKNPDDWCGQHKPLT